MIKKASRTSVRIKKHKKLRNKFSGTPERPRLSVYRSNSHIYAQIIDDTKGHTLVSASSKDLGLEKSNDIAAAVSVGEAIAKKALEANIEAVVFDRGGYIYHGKIKSLADAAREAGLKF
jgi:large subunit ribosomal protein L18